MKFYNLLKIIIVLACAFPIGAYAQECKAKVSIKTDLDSASIFVNNKFSGKGKVSLQLAKGIYEIMAVEPNYIWDAKTLTDTLIVDDCSKEKIVSMNFYNSLYLQTLPEDAYVYSGDSLIGYTPLCSPRKFNAVELKKTGYMMKKVDLNPSLPGQTFNLNYEGVPNGKNFFQRSLFKILIGSLVVLGGTTAYFKLKADDRFSQYQATGDETFLNQTRKFDLISGITLGALEINFGMLIYYFLTD